MAERTEILPCTCTHQQQDEMYGKQRRVHNVNTNGEAFCTVCAGSNRRSKNAASIEANKAFGNTYVPARKPRNPKSVPK